MTGAVINPKEVNGKSIPSFERNRKMFFGIGGAFTNQQRYNFHRG
ncbi:MAG TPA: hypothetical protein VN722_00250 [Hanamia sp.]|nr:hypothetical protein [Hanamia sp.]